MTLILGALFGFVWGIVGIYSQDFWWNKTIYICKPSFIQDVLASITGPFSYVVGYFSLGKDSGFDFFGREINL